MSDTLHDTADRRTDPGAEPGAEPLIVSVFGPRETRRASVTTLTPAGAHGFLCAKNAAAGSVKGPRLWLSDRSCDHQALAKAP